MEDSLIRKIYRPFALWLIMFPIILALVGTMLFAAIAFIFKLPILGETEWARWIDIVIAVLGLAMAAFLSWGFIGSFKGQKIVLSENEIYAPQNNWIKSQSYQLEVHIPYAVIANISFVVTTKTSEDKSVWYLGFPKDWAIFKMKDGEIKRLCIGLYTKKTEIKILDDIITRCAAVGNVLDISSGSEIIKRKKSK